MRGRALTRKEASDQLAARGIRLEGQAVYHLLRRAALEGLICFGGDSQGEPSYVLVDTWLGAGPEPLSEEAALQALARRYLAAHGPASLADLANWSGLPMNTLRRGWKSMEPETITVNVGPRHLSLLESQYSRSRFRKDASSNVRLVPAYDPYLLGHCDRELILAPHAARAVYPGGGVLRPAVLVDGCIVGSWNLKRYRNRAEVRVFAPRALATRTIEVLQKEVLQVGRFLDMETNLRLCS